MVKKHLPYYRLTFCFININYNAQIGTVNAIIEQGVSSFDQNESQPPSWLLHAVTTGFAISGDL